MYSMQFYLTQFLFLIELCCRSLGSSEFLYQVILTLFELDLDDALKINNHNLVIEYICVEDINTFITL